MYANHKSSNHDAWRSRMDKRCAFRTNNKREKPQGEKLPTDTPSQKLTLNDKLCNAFCTQAGLSAEAIDKIWEDAQGNE